MAISFQDTFAQALADQPTFQRRKDTITSFAGTVLQLANLGIFATADLPVWVNVVIATVIGICQILVHAGTKGAITPSQAARLEAAQAKLEAVNSPALPVYDGESTGDYVGAHRA